MKHQPTYKPMLFTGWLFLFLHSCNGGKDSKKAGATAPATHTVAIEQMKFSPAELTVNRGDTVVWINRDLVDHNVTDAASRQWASPSLPGGASWRRVVDESMVYLCTLHPMMKGTVVLK